MILRFLQITIFAVVVSSCSYQNIPEVTVDETFISKSEHVGSQKTDFFVFVGEKIEVTEFIPPKGELWFDQAFDVKYKIIERILGEFDGDIIEFRAFDHYGFPPFAKYKHALLFVSKEKGKLYHEKYQYFDVYQTTDGRWASCGDPYRFDDYHRKDFTLKNLTFVKPVVFDLEKLNSEQVEKMYPAPYFEIEGKNAKCLMGAYVDELLQVKTNGVLKARGVGQ